MAQYVATRLGMWSLVANLGSSQPALPLHPRRLSNQACCWPQPASPRPRPCPGLLLASVRDPNPVVFFEAKMLYRTAVEDVPQVLHGFGGM